MVRLIGNLIMTFLGLGLLAVAISFTASNDDMVQIGLWPITVVFSLPVWLVGLGGFGLGLITGGLAMSLPLMTSKWQQGRLKRKLTRLEKTQPVNHAENPGKTETTPRLPQS